MLSGSTLHNKHVISYIYITLSNNNIMYIFSTQGSPDNKAHLLVQHICFMEFSSCVYVHTELNKQQNGFLQP